MIWLIVSLVIGLGLPVMLWLLWRRNQAPPPVEGSGQKLIDARNALQRLQTDLLPSVFVSQIFNRSDLDYVMANAPREIQQRFLAERKRISIRWVQRVRAEVQELRRFHLGQSRFQEGLSLRSEIRLGFSFASLLLSSRLLELFLRIRGPYAVSRALSSTMDAADEVCSVSARSLAFLTAQGFDVANTNESRFRAMS